VPLAPLTRPIVFFDLETTGLLVELDRIIEIALIKIHPDGREERLCQRFNPGIKIPMESVAVHGITDDMLRGQPVFKEWASRLHALFEGADLGGFALQRLDIPLLTREFGRVGLPFPMEGRRIVDASLIFRQKERRDLKSAYRFYCGKDLVDAHSAAADTQATYEVFLAQLDRYADLPRDLDGLHDFCAAPEPGHVDREGRFSWRDGEAFFNFGKHRYHSLEQVSQEDPDYINWIIDKADFSPEVKEICRQARRGFFPRREAPPPPKP
jgi:DNA polymerase-3 subunit epsilon